MPHNQEVALATFAAHNLPDGVNWRDSDCVYDPDNSSYPHEAHLCPVDVETGFTRIR